MPGPGGGSHGGGGSRGGGGGFGGSHGGFGGSHGGFGGPRGGFFGSPYGGGWHHRPHYGGGGCLSGILGALFAPIILIMFVIALLGSAIGSCSAGLPGGTSSQSNAVQYDEEAFQDFADKQYAAEFGKTTAYEDNLLIVFLADDEEYYDYYYIAWVGDHIATDINYMLGNEQTELGQAMEASINETNYKYSLDSNLAQVVETMEQEITSKGLPSSFRCEEYHETPIQIESHLTNKTNIDMTESTVNDALKKFTDATGIPIVIVVEDIDDVF